MMNRSILPIIILLIVFLFVSCLRDDGTIEHKTYHKDGSLRSHQIIDTLNDKKCGVFYRIDGSKEKKYCLLKGKFDGEYIEYDAKNQHPKIIGCYNNGLMDGSFVTFNNPHDTSSIRHYDKGEKVGDWKVFWPNNRVKAINKYVDGQYVYKIRFDSIGNKLSETLFPLIKFNSDTLFIGDTLSIEFVLIDSLKDINDHRQWYVLYDFNTESEDLRYPNLSKSFDESFEAIGRVIVEDNSLDYVHGSLMQITNLGDTIMHEVFSKKIVVMQK